MSSHAFPGANKPSQYRSHPTGPNLKPRHGRWYVPLSILQTEPPAPAITALVPKSTILTRSRYIPLVAAVGLGFGAYNYYTEAQARRETAILEEEKRLAKNRELMDAYGNKESLHDVQHALEMYGR